MSVSNLAKKREFISRRWNCFWLYTTVTRWVYLRSTNVLKDLPDWKPSGHPFAELRKVHSLGLDPEAEAAVSID